MNEKMSNYQEDDRIKSLLEQYTPVILRMRAMYYVRDLSKDDWLQEGMIVIHKCLKAYKPEMGTSFGQYFKQAFQHHIFSLLRKQAAYKRKADTDALSYEFLTEKKMNDSIDSRHSFAAEDLISRLIVKETIENFPNYCSKTEREVLAKYLMNHSLEEIISESNRKPRSVRMAYNRALQKIREEMH